MSSEYAHSGIARLGLIQHACDPHKPTNLKKAEGLIRDAAAQGADLVVTQELFTCPYFPQTEDETQFALAESIPGPTSECLGALARELDIEIVASLFEKRAPGIFHNTCVLIGADGCIARRYRKMHIPDDPQFYEKFYFTPGDASSAWAACRTRAAHVGTLICWDQWFPEAARLSALGGSQILLYPSAIGWLPDESPEVQSQQKRAWQIVHQSHAVTNGVFVAAINRVGTEGEIAFWGESFVTDPYGQIVDEASSSEDQVLIVNCDLSVIDRARQAWPFLRDRRIDAYEGLTERYLEPPT